MVINNDLAALTACGADVDRFVARGRARCVVCVCYGLLSTRIAATVRHVDLSSAIPYASTIERRNRHCALSERTDKRILA
jgi:hypothetical protein